MFYGLRETTRLKKERACVVGYSVQETGALHYMHPIQAVLLTLCDGAADRASLATVLAEVLSLTPQKAAKIVDHTLADAESLLQPLPEPLAAPRRYDPAEFLYRPAGDPHLTRLTSPITVAWLITQRCPFDCIYCCIPTVPAGAHVPDELDAEEALAFLEQCVEIGVQAMVIHGGEPFLRPDVPDLIDYLLKHDVWINISTKLPLKERIVARLAESGLPSLQLSVDSSDPETADRLVARRNFLEGFYRNVELLLEYGVMPEANVVVTGYNIGQIPALIRDLEHRGVTKVSLSGYLRSFHKHDDRLFPDPEDLLGLDAEVRVLSEELPHLDIDMCPITSPRESSLCGQELAGCSGGKTGIVVGSEGNVSFCDRLLDFTGAVVGNIREASIMEIWNGERLLDFVDPAPTRFDGTSCESCTMMGECNKRMRCYYRAQLVDQRFYGPDYLCPRVPAPETRFF